MTGLEVREAVLKSRLWLIQTSYGLQVFFKVASLGLDVYDVFGGDKS